LSEKEGKEEEKVLFLEIFSISMNIMRLGREGERETERRKINIYMYR
jgi:hypothetical protein